MELLNTVEYIGHYGSDEIIACSAWTSTSRDLTEEKKNRIPKLINMLWAEGHHTPFEKGIVHFLVNTDIASHIHLLKHRIASINAECLHGDTLISFENIDGSISQKIKIKDLYEKYNNGRSHQNTEKDKKYSQKRIRNMRIRVLNEKNGIFTYSHIKDIWQTGEKNLFEIILKNGKTIKCSDNHPLYTKEGYLSINDGLTVGKFVGCNGITIEDEKRPWTFKEFFNGSEDFTRMEFAKLKNIKYNLLKKWGYIYSINFKEDVNKSYKQGHSPWNKGKTGYSINISEKGMEGRIQAIKRGSESHFWRGGITDERSFIGEWTRKQASKVHEKFNHTCQKCGKSGVVLHAHHIIPVVQDISKSKCFDNLITVCDTCHKDIHKSLSNEEEFAKSVLSEDFKPFEYSNKIGRTKINNLKMLHFSEIVSIKPIGKDICYDIEIEGEYKNFVANGIVTHNSARYKELKEDKYYIPPDWKLKVKEEDPVKCFGHLLSIHGEPWAYILEEYTKFGNELYHRAIQELQEPLGRKRAKETARFFKTYNSQIQADVAFNMRSFANFLKLRDSEHAQTEIRDVAKQMVEIVKNIEGNPFEHTLKAWGY